MNRGSSIFLRLRSTGGDIELPEFEMDTQPPGIILSSNILSKHYTEKTAMKNSDDHKDPAPREPS